MSRAISIHLGLNRIDPAHYGTEGALRGCVNDATSMQAIARTAGFDATLLTNEEATSTNLLAFLHGAQNQLASGDTLLVTYAGHGSQVPDLNHDEAPYDKDDTWCTYDRMVVDDELGEAWSGFAPGVRIVIVSDSCHSATIARALELISASLDESTPRNFLAGPLIGDPHSGPEVLSYRTLPAEVAEDVNARHRQFYADIQQATRGDERVTIAASVITLAACQDDETAGDGHDHGQFTQSLLDVWNNAAYRGCYRDFLEAIKAKVRGQHPNYEFDGAPNPPFERETPFTISSKSRAEEGGKELMTQKSDVIDLDDELRAVKSNGNGHGSRQVFDTSDKGSWARMEILVPRQFVVDSPDDDVYKFLKEDGADALMKAVIGVRKISIPRGIEGSAGCSVDHQGHVECHAEVHF